MTVDIMIPPGVNTFRIITEVYESFPVHFVDDMLYDKDFLLFCSL